MATVFELMHEIESQFPEGTFLLGFLHLKGYGVQKDREKAGAYFLRAAQDGLPSAQFTLGRLIQSGHLVNQDNTQAAYWYGRAAEQGHSVAALHLGYMLDVGDGITKDAAEARKWYERSAELGCAAAAARLAELYEACEAYQTGDSSALAWYEKAAEMGDEGALRALSRIYRAGLLGKQSDEAYANELDQKAALLKEERLTREFNAVRIAALHGDKSCQELLGFMYRNDGCGTLLDADKADFWIRKSNEEIAEP